MAFIVKDRVQETTATAGTGTLTLGGTVLGFQSFAAIGNGNTTYYAINDPITGDWEVGIGTYTSSGTTLSRDTVLSSSNGGSLVSFASGTKNVFCTYPSERAVYLDSAGAYPVQNTFNTLNATTAVLTAGTIATTPSSGTDIVNKTYVDTLAASGIHFHQPVRVESPINLNATYNNGTAGVGATLTNAGTQVALVIDGVTVAVNDRVLVYQQTTQTENGIYVVSNVGSGSTNWVLTRSSDADTYVINSAAGLSEGSTVFVQQGATGAGETYTCNTSGVITFGTTNITFAQISSAQIYSAGTGLTLSGTTFSIANTAVTPATYGTQSSVGTFTVNAQGQITNAVDTAIAISSAAVSGLAASATTDTTNANNITSGSLGTSRLSGSYTGVTGVGTLTAGTWNANTIAAIYGGTGLASYTAGDLIYANSSTTLAALADVAVGNALISGGVGADPSWGKIGLATHVSGTLPIANGGSGQTSAQAAMNAFAGAVTSGSYLRGNGTNVVMSTIQAADVPTLNQNTTGNAATATTATNQSGGTVNATTGTFSSTVTGPNFRDATGAYNVNLGSGGTAGRGVVAGYSGGAYGGIGYNVTHTASSGVYTAPAADSTSYLLFNAGGFNFLGAGGGAAGRTISYSTLATITSTGITMNGTTFTTNGAVNTYGATTIRGSKNGWSGLGFQDSAGTFCNTLMARSSDGYGGIYNKSDNNWLIQWDGSGNITGTGNVTAYSDERYKTNWRSVTPEFVEKLSQVRSGVYDRTDQDITQAGVSAQSWQEVLPETVLEDESGRLSVAYGNAALVACVELAKEVMKLRAEIDALKARG